MDSNQQKDTKEQKQEETKVQAQSDSAQQNKTSDEAVIEDLQKISQDLKVNPYEVENQSGKEIDYNKLIDVWGCKPITQELIDRIEKVTQKPVHHFLKRGIFFSHRDLEAILDNYEKGKTFYLYTGRGPSGDSMHIGHLLPFIFTKYLQEVFDVPLVIQITDDEKFFHKGTADLEQYQKWGIDNIKDIIAVGFNPEKTFIFQDTEYIGDMYLNICKFQKCLTFNNLRSLFGLTESDNCGKIAYPAIQAAPCFSTSFPHIFGEIQDKKKKKPIPIQCLIPQGIDQDPYFRMTRVIFERLKQPKPACIHSKFFPGLMGFGTKMSTSDPNTVIFLTDTPKQIKQKIQQSVSGGGDTKELHEKNGANLDVDIPYHYLRFFLEDDNQLEEIKKNYGSGKMYTSEVKKLLTDVLTKIITDHQTKKKQVTDEMIKQYKTIRKISPFPAKKQQQQQQQHLEQKVESQTHETQQIQQQQQQQQQNN